VSPTRSSLPSRSPAPRPTPSACGRPGRPCGGRAATRSGDPATVVTFEPVEGGRIYERTPAGVQHDWGRILAWEPPGRLVYLWHLDATDPTDATEVTVTFRPAEGGATLVTIVHQGWERLAADGRGRRRRNLGGWASLLPHYQSVVVAAQ
jgi:uncharacterized protein YndB with AHSA1/START domain